MTQTVRLFVIAIRLHSEGNTIVLVTHQHDVAEYAHRTDKCGSSGSKSVVSHPLKTAKGGQPHLGLIRRLDQTRPLPVSVKHSLPLHSLAHLTLNEPLTFRRDIEPKPFHIVLRKTDRRGMGRRWRQNVGLSKSHAYDFGQCFDYLGMTNRFSLP